MDGGAALRHLAEQDRRSAILIVPSALTPSERNWLLNPQHPEFSKIRLGSAEPFEYDPRCFKP
jgi:RES domain-containing protein